MDAVQQEMLATRVSVGERTDTWTNVSGAEHVSQAAAKLARLGNSAGEIETRKRYLDLLHLRSGEIVVDVGAGSGVVTTEMARRVGPGGRVFAVDPSAGLLDYARVATREADVGHLVDCRVANGRALPFGLAAFDAAICHWVLLHADRPHEIIAEMKRVTRRGGRVLCVEADWETAIVHPGEIAITRRILNHAATRHVDGWIGRKLAGLFAAQGFAEVVVEPVVTMDYGQAHGANDDRAWLDFLFERAALAVSADVVGREEAVTWMAKLDEGFHAKDFFFAVTQFAVLGRVPS